MVFLKEFFEKFDFEKNLQTTKKKKTENFPGGKELILGRTMSYIIIHTNIIINKNGPF